MGLLSEEWQSDAACRDMDVTLFFPTKRSEEAEALAVCEACAVRDECAQYAIDNGIAFGVYGGVTERERNQRTRVVRCAQCDRSFVTQRGSFCSDACRKAQNRKRGRGRYQRRKASA